MKAFSARRFHAMGDFLISRAFILLIISIFLFPLIIQARTTRADQDNSWRCNLNSFSFSQNESPIFLDPTLKKSLSKSPLQALRPIDGNSYALSVLGWWTCPPSLIFGEQKKKKKKKKKLTQHTLSMWNHFHFEAALEYLTKSYLQTIRRTLLLLSLWLCSRWLPSWVVWLPAAEWIFCAIWLAWPWLGSICSIIRGKKQTSHKILM